MNKRLLSIAFVLFTSCAAAQPFLFYRGVGNAASYIPSGLPGGQLARGSIFSLFGRAMGPAQGVQVSAFPLATTLAGVGVDVCQGGACTPAIPIYVRQDQINAILPSNAPLGEVSLRVTYNGVAGNFTSASVISRGVGLFTINSAGFGPAVAQNFLSPADQPVNSADTPAKPGQTLVLWATGLGPGLNGDNLAPQVGDIASVDIWVGGKPVTTRRYQGRSGCCSGLDQIIFDLPADTPTGCYVPIQIAVEGVVSNTATIAVSSDGSACADRFHPVSERFRGGGRLGLVSVNRSNILKNLGTPQPDVTAESVTATFRRVSGGAFSFTPEISLPPLGSCSAQTARGDLFGGDSLPGFAAPAAELDAGPQIRVAQQPAERDALTKFYAAQIASSQTRLKLPASALTPSFAVTGAGGSDIGSFQFSLAAAGTIAFENRAALEIVDRSKDLAVRWQGGSPDTDVILVMGVGVNLPGNSSIQFLCTADPAAGSFNIPARMLQMFPRMTQTAKATAAFSQISVGRVPLRAPQTFSAPGLDAGFALASQWSGRVVIIP